MSNNSELTSSEKNPMFSSSSDSNLSIRIEVDGSSVGGDDVARRDEIPGSCAFKKTRLV